MPEDQDHDKATYCHKFTKADGQLKIDPHNLPTGVKAKETLCKIKAFVGFPGTFFFYNDKRIKVVDAKIWKDRLSITRIIPEGKKEMNFADLF